MLLLTPFVVAKLGKNGYGIWVLVQSFSGFYGLINVGVVAATTRYIAAYASKGEYDSLNKVAATSLAMFSATAFIVATIAFLLGGPLSSFFRGVDPENLTAFRYVVWIIGTSVGITFISGVFGGILAAHERYVVANSINLAINVTRALLTVLLLLMGHGLIGVAMASVISSTMGLLAFYGVHKKVTPHVTVRIRNAEWKVWRTLIVYGGGSFLIVVADLLKVSLGSAIIGRCIDIDSVAIYGIAAIIVRRVLTVIGSGLGVLTPRFASLEATGHHDEIRVLFLKSQTLSTVISFGVCTLLFIFGERFIVLWVGEEFRTAGGVLMILLVSYAISLSQNPSVRLMYATNKHYYYALATIIEAVLNVSISIALVTRYGIFGVAWGTTIATLIIKVLFQPVYVSRLMGISLRQYLKFLIIIPTLSALMISLANTWDIPNWLTAYSWFGLIAMVVLSAITFALVSTIAIRMFDRNLFYSLLRRPVSTG
jgi:O-antigen/teichoic acid export membrane protein